MSESWTCRSGLGADCSMIAESVSKAASGGDLGVDDTRFEELMADVDDDEDDLLVGGDKVSKRVRPLVLQALLYTRSLGSD